MPTRVPRLGHQLTTLGELPTEDSPFTSVTVPHRESGAAATAALSLGSELLASRTIRARLEQASLPRLAIIESMDLIVTAPVGAAHAGDAHGVKLLQKRLRLEVLDDEKPPVHPRLKTWAGHAASSCNWQIWGASPSSHSWENLQFSPFLQVPALWALHIWGFWPCFSLPDPAPLGTGATWF